MAKFEQMVCGLSPENPGEGRTILSRSPGMGAAVSAEILRLCTGWGTPTLGCLSRPAILSFPLQATMPSLRGPLYTVIRVSAGDPLFFHAVVLTRQDYRDFGFSPFAVVRAGAFLDSWSGSERLARGQWQGTGTAQAPRSDNGDVGLVDDALKLLLTKGKLVLDLEEAGADSDRTLELVVACTPLAVREQMRFASFAPPGDNQYTLAASYARNTPFSGWRRIFMTTLDHGTTPAVRDYVSEVSAALARDEVGSLKVQRNPAAAGTAAAPSTGGSRVAGPAGKTAGRPAGAGGGPPIRPITAAVITGPSRAGSYRDPVVPATGPGRSHLVRQPFTLGRQRRRGPSRMPAAFLLTVALLAAGWIYLDRSGKGREWGIFDLANLGSPLQREERDPSLLDVVDVGRHYEKQLGRIQRGKLVPGADRDKALRRAQADLLADAAGPLLVQIELYLELAAAGIQQGHRPDREQDRLGALQHQGEVLAAETARLELAYFSFRQGVLWQDVHLLPDAAVFARRDSLARSAAGPLEETGRELGTGPLGQLLAAANRNVTGMATLLALYRQPEWSLRWENDLKQAAEMVSPTASPITRAYRNNAFTLVRLKKAERHEANQAAAFAGDYLQGAWASPAVRDILPELRRRAGLFAGESLPDLLAEMLILYSRLENPGALVEELARSEDGLRAIRENAAFRFDSATFRNFLDRIRLEAAAGLLASQADPSPLPAHLARDLDEEALRHFQILRREGARAEEWLAVAELAGDSFLGRWSRYRAETSRQHRQDLRRRFDEAWSECLHLAGELRARAELAEDWTSVWVDLDNRLAAALAAAEGLDGDLAGTLQRDQAAAWRADLNGERPLDVESVVIRLAPEMLGGPAELEVELRNLTTGQGLPVRRLQVGPAAPAGTGWVGTGEVAWTLTAGPHDAFAVKVRDPQAGTVLLDARYAALSDRVGPGGMTRLKATETGSIIFRIDPGWWRGLSLPQIP